jgi:hypothetical protein
MYRTSSANESSRLHNPLANATLDGFPIPNGFRGACHRTVHSLFGDLPAFVGSLSALAERCTKEAGAQIFA